MKKNLLLPLFVLLFTVFAPHFSPVLLAQSVTDSAPCDSIKRVVVRDTVTPSLLRFGVGGEYALLFVNAKFAGLPNVPSCCPEYGFTSGFGVGGSVFAEMPLWSQIGVGARLGLSSVSVNFSRRQTLPVVNAQTLVPIVYELSTTLLPLSIEPYLFFRPADMLTVQAGIGITTMLSGSYNQQERLDTVGLTFSNLRRVQNVSSGAISNLAPLLPSVRIGASYEVPLTKNGNILIAPEVSFNLALGDVVRELRGANASWSMSSARVGASVRYSPERATRLAQDESAALQAREDEVWRQKREECARRVAVAKPTVKNVVTAAITAISAVNADSVSNNPTLAIEEFRASRSRYVLNTIFFGVGTNQIAPRYELLKSGEQAAFRFESFDQSTVLQIYYHVLNIIGKRLQINPKADITLVGHADGLTEKNDKALAIARAESVKEYLKRTWNIEDKRIKIQTAVSRTPTGTDGDDTLEAEEQRRVEIQSATRSILEELRYDYTMRVIRPQKIRLQFALQSTAVLKEWVLDGVQTIPGTAKKVTLFETKGTSNPADASYEWDIANAQNQPQSGEPVVVSLRAADVDNLRSEISTKEIPVRLLTTADKDKMRVPDKRIDSYTLFSFAYGTNAPISGNADVQRVVAAIKQTLKPGAQVTVSGYTDIRGNELTNGILAQQRANAVAGLIGYPNMIVNSVGATRINDNSLPEGRYYNRFVQVDIQTPLR
jgi:outer membrane protein OmpA-like peptidoglycan-associated protein